MSKPNEKHLDKNPSEIDWARAAAYIDGEGCIFIGKRKLRSGSINTSLDVRVANNDPRLMCWFEENFGGNILNITSKQTRCGKWTKGYQWSAVGRGAQWLLEGCMRFLLLKREQAEVGLAHQLLCGYRGAAKRTEENIAERIALRDKLSTMKGQASRRKDIVIPIREAV